jgi:hypothetical protein
VECGQPTYKISQRVVELGVRHLGEGVKQIFKGHYKRRSLYLHAGHVRSSQPIKSHLVPQLDPNGIEGCAMPSMVGAPTNLMEFARFVIRKEMLSTQKPAQAGEGLFPNTRSFW